MIYSLAVSETKMLRQIETEVPFPELLRFVISKDLIKSKQLFLCEKANRAILLHIMLLE